MKTTKRTESYTHALRAGRGSGFHLTSSYIAADLVSICKCILENCFAQRAGVTPLLTTHLEYQYARQQGLHRPEIPLQRVFEGRNG